MKRFFKTIQLAFFRMVAWIMTPFLRHWAFHLLQKLRRYKQERRYRELISYEDIRRGEHPHPEMLRRYMDARLPKQAQPIIKQHLLECSECLLVCMVIWLGSIEKKDTGQS
ncbi:MAG: hypothetical protein Q8P45_00615 [Candidatus Harrisonbacteria bacterium]|nr:hypothetical protein [Candidatus Harrisonbacteria bacterium]